MGRGDDKKVHLTASPPPPTFYSVPLRVNKQTIKFKPKISANRSLNKRPGGSMYAIGTYNSCAITWQKWRSDAILVDFQNKDGQRSAGIRVIGLLRKIRRSRDTKDIKN